MAGRRSPRVARPASAPSGPSSPSGTAPHRVRYMTDAMLARQCGTEQFEQVKKLVLRGHAPDQPPIRVIENLDRFVALRELVLSRHEISRLDGLQRLVQLTKLDVSDNAIARLDGVGVLARLQELDASGNRIERIPGSIGKLRRLRHLRLANNPLAVLSDAVVLRRNSNLTLLSLAGSDIAALPHYRSYVVFHVPTLVQLDAEAVQVSERELARPVWSRADIDAAQEAQAKQEGIAKALRVDIEHKDDQIKQLQSRVMELEARSAEQTRSNLRLTDELRTKTALLNKKTSELTRVTETLAEVQQDLAFYKIESAFANDWTGSLAVPMVRSDDTEQRSAASYQDVSERLRQLYRQYASSQVCLNRVREAAREAVGAASLEKNRAADLRQETERLDQQIAELRTSLALYQPEEELARDADTLTPPALQTAVTPVSVDRQRVKLAEQQALIGKLDDLIAEMDHEEGVSQGLIDSLAEELVELRRTPEQERTASAVERIAQIDAQLQDLVASLRDVQAKHQRARDERDAAVRDATALEDAILVTPDRRSSRAARVALTSSPSAMNLVARKRGLEQELERVQQARGAIAQAAQDVASSLTEAMNRQNNAEQAVEAAACEHQELEQRVQQAIVELKVWQMHANAPPPPQQQEEAAAGTEDAASAAGAEEAAERVAVLQTQLDEARAEAQRHAEAVERLKSEFKSSMTENSAKSRRIVMLSDQVSGLEAQVTELQAAADRADDLQRDVSTANSEVTALKQTAYELASERDRVVAQQQALLQQLEAAVGARDEAQQQVEQAHAAAAAATEEAQEAVSAAAAAAEQAAEEWKNKFAEATAQSAEQQTAHWQSKVADASAVLMAQVRESMDQTMQLVASYLGDADTDSADDADGVAACFAKLNARVVMLVEHLSAQQGAEAMSGDEQQQRTSRSAVMPSPPPRKPEAAVAPASPSDGDGDGDGAGAGDVDGDGDTPLAGVEEARTELATVLRKVKASKEMLVRTNEMYKTCRIRLEEAEEQHKQQVRVIHAAMAKQDELDRAIAERNEAMTQMLSALTEAEEELDRRRRDLAALPAEKSTSQQDAAKASSASIASADRSITASQRAQQAALQEAIERLQREHEQLKQQSVQLRLEAAEAETQRDRVTQDLESQRQQLATLEREVEALTQQRQRQSDVVEASQQRVDVLQAETEQTRASLQQDLVQVQLQLDAARQQLEHTRAEHDAMVVQSESEQQVYRAALAELEQQLADARTQLDDLVSSSGDTVAMQRSASKPADGLVADRQDTLAVRQELDAARAALRSSQSELEVVRDQLRSAQSEVDELQQDAATSESLRAELAQQQQLTQTQQDQLAQQQQQLQTQRDELTRLQQQSQAQQMQAQAVEEEVRQRDARTAPLVTELEHKLVHLRQAVSQEQQQLEAARSALAEAQASVTQHQQQSADASTRDDTEAAAAARTQLETTLAALRAAVAAEQKRLEAAEREFADFVAQVGETQQRLRELQMRHTGDRADIQAQMQAQQAAVEEWVRQANEAASHLHTALARVPEEAAMARARDLAQLRSEVAREKEMRLDLAAALQQAQQQAQQQQQALRQKDELLAQLRKDSDATLESMRQARDKAVSQAQAQRQLATELMQRAPAPAAESSVEGDAVARDSANAILAETVHALREQLRQAKETIVELRRAAAASSDAVDSATAAGLSSPSTQLLDRVQQELEQQKQAQRDQAARYKEQVAQLQQLHATREQRLEARIQQLSAELRHREMEHAVQVDVVQKQLTAMTQLHTRLTSLGRSGSGPGSGNADDVATLIREVRDLNQQLAQQLTSLRQQRSVALKQADAARAVEDRDRQIAFLVKQVQSLKQHEKELQRSHGAEQALLTDMLAQLSRLEASTHDSDSLAMQVQLEQRDATIRALQTELASLRISAADAASSRSASEQAARERMQQLQHANQSYENSVQQLSDQVRVLERRQQRLASKEAELEGVCAERDRLMDMVRRLTRQVRQSSAVTDVSLDSARYKPTDLSEASFRIHSHVGGAGTGHATAPSDSQQQHHWSDPAPVPVVPAARTPGFGHGGTSAQHVAELQSQYNKRVQFFQVIDKLKNEKIQELENLVSATASASTPQRPSDAARGVGADMSSPHRPSASDLTTSRRY